MKRRFGLALWSACLLIAAPAHALTLEELLKSSSKHYPSIEKMRAGLGVGEGRVQQARGAFDWELNQKSISRISGFYDGDYADTQVTRRLADSATRIYGGYRISDGGFPVYEDQRVTLDGGEFNVGVALSLWRNRIIDEERFEFTDSELELKQRSIDLLLTQLGVQYDAMLAYINWLGAGKALSVAQGMLKLAEDRQEAFKSRVARGDLAEIYLTENMQYIASRRAGVNDAKLRLENAASKLSLYWRDAEGQPLLPKSADLPKQFPSLKSFAINLNAEIERARSLRPDLIRLSLDKQREQNKLALGENKTRPKVDLVVEGARDVGDNSFAQRSRAGNEAKIGLNISIPLQRNVGEGLMRQSQHKIRQLEQEIRLLNDQIATEIQIAANNYHNASENVKLAQREINATVSMEKAERERFGSGAADFFVLNMREERTADARLKQIMAQQKLWQAIAGYYLATLQVEKMML